MSAVDMVSGLMRCHPVNEYICSTIIAAWALCKISCISYALDDMSYEIHTNKARHALNVALS